MNVSVSTKAEGRYEVALQVCDEQPVPKRCGTSFGYICGFYVQLRGFHLGVMKPGKLKVFHDLPHHACRALDSDTSPRRPVAYVPRVEPLEKRIERVILSIDDRDSMLFKRLKNSVLTTTLTFKESCSRFMNVALVMGSQTVVGSGKQGTCRTVTSPTKFCIFT